MESSLVETRERYPYWVSIPTRLPDVEEQIRPQGIEPMTGTPGEFAAFRRADIRKWGELVRRTGARID